MASSDRQASHHAIGVKLGNSNKIGSLTDRCIDVIVKNFADFPVHEHIPTRLLRRITARVSHSLNPEVAAAYIFDDDYWKMRCYQNKFAEGDVIEHVALSWKQFYFEAYLRQTLEDHSEGELSDTSTATMLESIAAYQDYIFSLKLRVMVGRLDMHAICSKLPNLTQLNLSYGAKKAGMQFDRMLFGMKISDANSLQQLLSHGLNLTSLTLQSNLIDDDLLRILLTGLTENRHITHLDLSHNKITNHGIRMLTKILEENGSVLTSLMIANNQIHAEGGRHMGRLLQAGSSLTYLDMRLNFLGDKGGCALFEGLVNNQAMMKLILSANSLQAQAAAALANVLEHPESCVQVVDVSSNHFQVGDLIRIKQSIQSNRALTSVDLRMENMSSQQEEVVAAIKTHVYNNELRVLS